MNNGGQKLDGIMTGIPSVEIRECAGCGEMCPVALKTLDQLAGHYGIERWMVFCQECVDRYAAGFNPDA